MTTQGEEKPRKNRKRKRRSSNANRRRVERKNDIQLSELEPSFTGKARYSVSSSDRHRRHIGIVKADGPKFKPDELKAKVISLCDKFQKKKDVESDVILST